MPYRMTGDRPSDVHRLPMWVLEMFTRGRLSVAVEGQPWRTLTAGEGILYAPGTGYRERRAGRGKACESLCVFFSLDHRPPFDAWRGLKHRLVVDTDRRIMPLLEQIVQHHELSDADALIAQGAFLQTLGLLLAAGAEGDTLIVGDTSGGGDDGLPARLHRYMRASLDQPLTLECLAEAMDMSTSALSHTYRGLTGDSPIAALRRMRVDAARAHLASRRLSLTEIADLTGFSDAFHLSRTFKRLTGQSPSDYRDKSERG